MAQAMVAIRMDETLKMNMESICKELGMSMTTAFTVFAKQVTRERRIPFEISADPFYSAANQKHLRSVIDEIDGGKAKFVVKTMDELEEMADE